MEHIIKQDPHGDNPGYSPSQTSDQPKPQQRQQHSTDYSRYRTSQRPLAGGRRTQKQPTPQTSFIGSLAALEHILGGDISNREDYEQRTQYAQQLDKFISDSCTSGVIQWHRQDMMQIVEIGTYYSEQSLSELLSTLDIPVTIKECLSRILATAACHTRLDLLLGWLLDRLNRPLPITTTGATSTEYKYWLLSILQEAIVRAQVDTFTQRQLQECAPSIMTNIMLFLDTTEAIQQLEIVLRILSSLSNYYSTAFVTHFQSLVDLLVGWCLDAETSDEHCDIIYKELLGFGFYWNTSIVFGFELLQHFINDLYGQTQEMKVLEDSDNLKKKDEKSCERLLRCFYCLSQSVIPLITSLDQYHQINTLFYQLRSDTIMLFLQALDIKCLRNKSWFDQCNQIMLLLSSIHPITFQSLQHSMYYYFNTQFDQSFMTPIIYIQYLLKMIDNSKATGINQEMIQELLDTNQSPLFSLFDSQQEIFLQQGIMLIFYHIFTTSPTSLLFTYSIQWTTLLQPTIIFKTPTIYQNMPMISQMMNTTTHSKMMATENNNNTEKIDLDTITYCQLLLKTAMAVKKNGNNGHVDAIQYRHEYQAILTLCELWQQGEYCSFDIVLTFLIHYWSTYSNNNTITPQNSLLHDLTLSRNWEKLSIHSKSALLDFILQNINSNNSTTLQPIMSHLVEAETYEISPSIKEKIIRLFTMHGKYYNYDFDSPIALHFQSSMTSSHSNIKRAARDYIQAFNPFTMVYTSPTLYSKKTNRTQLLKAIMMSTPHTGDFRPIHYELVMKKLGMQHLLVGHNNTIDQLEQDSDHQDQYDWARRLFYSCGGTLSLENTDLYRQQIDLNQRNLTTLLNESGSLLYYWALWECSRYCILSRLRTPFGAPQQTFAAFEKSLIALVHEDNNTMSNTSEATQLYGLLTLLDRLEIQIYNAVEGNTNTSTTTNMNGSPKSNNAPTVMPMVPKGNFTFFHTNRKTCHDYYMRIRPLLIQGAKKLNWDTFFLKHAMMLLSSYEQQTFSSVDTLLAFFQKINPYVKDIVDTCIRHNMVDMITGLEKWYEQMVNKGHKDVPSFGNQWYFNGWIGPLRNTTFMNTNWTSWFQIANDFAMGHDENAITVMSQFDIININSSEANVYAQPILDMLNKHALDFYTSLEDYDSIKSVCQQYPYLFSTNISTQLVDFSEIKSPSPPPTIDQTTILSLDDDKKLEPLVQLGRLTTFRKNVLDSASNKKLSQLICQRLLPCLEKDDLPLDSLIFANHRTNLVEIQLQHRLFVDNSQGTTTMIPGLPPLQHHQYHDTKTWARLSNSSSHMTANEMQPALYLKTAQVAKQQLNYRTASTYLDQFFSSNNSIALKHQAMYEKINLALAIGGGRNTDCWKNAFLSFNSMLLSMNDDLDNNDQRLLKTKIFLKMAKVFQDNNNDETASSSLMNDPNVSLWLTKDSAVSTLISKAIHCTIDTFAKPWFVYGEHCYQQACQLLGEINQFIQNPTTVISFKIQHVQSTWHKILSSQTHISQDQYVDYEKLLWRIFKKYSITMITNESDNHQVINMLLEKLQQHGILNVLPQDIQIGLLTPLLTIQTTLINHFRTAISAFFRYLNLTDTTTISSMLTRATLYLLQTLVQYGDALQTEFENEMGHAWGPAQLLAWKQIMPQLFSRLVNHSSAFVKKILGHWIGQLVDAFPHQVIYHIIVGITSGRGKETQQVLHNQVDRIKAQSDHVWTTTRRMTEELERMTVLWEETWLHRISTLQLDVMNQWEQLDKALQHPCNNNNNNNGLEIYKTLMQHVIHSLYELMSTTINGQDNMTPHEKWFDATFGKSIRHAYELVETPESLDTYRKGWDRFQQIHRQLTIETQKYRVFDLKHVSPYLANFQDETSIRMPGLDPSSSVHIHHFGTTLTVLPTKTKPKKMNLYGTDGNTYTYLFKGLEDLQLDERIMQLLDTTNVLLGEDPEASKRHLQARTYAVIPMSAHSGMIQWVKQATPLFALYKNWQKRSYLNTMMPQQQQSNLVPPQQQRPTEHYIEKVLQKMKVAGLRVTTNRRHWPSDILCAVYNELTEETPNDLLSKAIWWSSTDSQDYLNKRSRLARTMAVMSMIGYVIGLGDRHLDNMMMDDTTGDIIHIDYNVCFEKGTTLRVPERVPYRLTRNMVYALGFLKGDFGAAAEHTLRILRQHKTLLLGLMEDTLVVEEPLLTDEKMMMVTNVETSYGMMMGTATKEEQQRLGLQESLLAMAEKLVKMNTVREKQHESIMNDLLLEKQRLQQLEDQYQQENDLDDNYDDEQDDDDDDVEDEEDTEQSKHDLYPLMTTNKTSPPSDWEREEHHSELSNTSSRIHAPSNIQTQIRKQFDHILQQLHQPYDSSATLTIHDMLPLLDSIRMMEMEENNEIHAAQQSAKIILDTLQWLDTCITKLGDKKSFTFSKLIEMVHETMNCLDQYYASLRMLESFGGSEQSKVVTTSSALPCKPGHTRNRNATKTDVMKRVRQKLEGKDEDYVSSVDEIMTVAEQVSKTIEQATSVQNLSLMYEGWTSWV